MTNPTKNSPHLALYHFEGCPFCQRVVECIKELQVAVEMRDIRSEAKHYEKLLQDTRRQTVPCLYIDGNPMHESSDIIDWLRENHQSLLKA